MPKPPSEQELADALHAQDPATGDLAGVGAADLLARLAHAVAGAHEPDGTALRVACRELARELARRAPGRTVELRIPPYAAVQCVPGPRHTRGTPPNVVEVQPLAWVRVATGALGWQEAARDGRLLASGERSDLSGHLPLV